MLPCACTYQSDRKLTIADRQTDAQTDRQTDRHNHTPNEFNKK